MWSASASATWKLARRTSSSTGRVLCHIKGKYSGQFGRRIKFKRYLSLVVNWNSNVERTRTANAKMSTKKTNVRTSEDRAGVAARGSQCPWPRSYQWRNVSSAVNKTYTNLTSSSTQFLFEFSLRASGVRDREYWVVAMAKPWTRPLHKSTRTLRTGSKTKILKTRIASDRRVCRFHLQWCVKPQRIRYGRDFGLNNAMESMVNLNTKWSVVVQFIWMCLVLGRSTRRR